MQQNICTVSISLLYNIINNKDNYDYITRLQLNKCHLTVDFKTENTSYN